MSVPVTILTGFLGSGKTTVLQKILAQENYGDTAVLVNEFGEVGIDQQLVAPIAPNVVLLDSGADDAIRTEQVHRITEIHVGVLLLR